MRRLLTQKVSRRYFQEMADRRRKSYMSLLAGVVIALLGLPLLSVDRANAGHDEAINERFFPQAVAFWTKDHGIIGGRVGRHGLIAVTRDGGETWHRTFRTARGREVVRLAVAANSAWAEVEACRTCRKRLLHSTDGGWTWSHLPKTRLEDVSFIDDSHGWALGRKSPTKRHDFEFNFILKETHNAGRNWSRVTRVCRHGYWVGAGLVRTGSAEGWVVCASEPATAMQKKIVTHTTDAGATWQRPGDAIWSGHYVGVFFTPSDHGWLWTNRSTVYRTDDGGANWEGTRFFESEVDFVASMWFVDNDRGYALYRNGDRGGAEQLIFSRDGGRTWRVRQTWH